MKKCIVRAMGIVLTAGLVITSVAVQKNVVSADAVTGTSKYIAFGADLNAKEKAAVLDGFGITESDLSDYKTIEITNKDEHDYLGDYMSDSVIGTRALSSVMVVKADENSGVAWFSPEEALKKSTEPWFVENVYTKLIRKLLIGDYA